MPTPVTNFIPESSAITLIASAFRAIAERAIELIDFFEDILKFSFERKLIGFAKVIKMFVY